LKPDLELQAWREQWQADTEVPADLRLKVERESRNMRLLVAAEIAVTLVIGGGSTLLALMDPRTEMIVLAAAVWVLFAAAWAFAIMNRQGIWSPAAVSTAEFVSLSIRRCQRSLAAVAFGAVLYFVEMAFCLTWLYWDPARRTPLPAIVFAAATPVFLIWLLRYRRQKKAELERLREMQ
jgi:hypothetical protein